ncbi:uncharacterized protein B0I36DRAFT_314051 [Microdochium trichocladiopsis]|uniref:Mpv17/PMP22 family protein n=1 Tax=Microdochium trichocladiopsis TaxID=1682393 RepID=A0A9P8YGC1_9PEZI|nr:uncharacterized protein B0I36DRAFT_314051 [Microdochium trichocladiopsis]KAH7037433.1 hypothetical protein B0I36DRAFT_314051 [Microdochium trichocladiopsis]
MASPMIRASRMAAVLAVISNLLAQSIKAYQRGTPLVIDWVPVFQFVVWALVNTPPNFLWQEFLESTFPAYHASPTREAVVSASKPGPAADDALEGNGEAAPPPKLVEPRLNKGNTAIKLLLDQTVGAALNTILFSLFMHTIQAAMHRPLGAPLSNPDQSVWFLLAGLFPSLFGGAGDSLLGKVLAGKGAGGKVKAFDYSRVSWPVISAKSRAEFVPIMVAGWKLWPLVSLINFTLVQTIEGRSLVGGLAGVAWGVYMSLLSSS